MISHIRLQNHKALKVADLTSLGKVNVICGTNNSGKTTLLERLASGKETLLAQSLQGDHETIVELERELKMPSNQTLIVLGHPMVPGTFLEKATLLPETIRRTLNAFPRIFDEIAPFRTEMLKNAVEVVAENKRAGASFRFDINSFLGKETFRSQLNELLDSQLARFFEKRVPPPPSADKIVLVTPKRKVSSVSPIAVGKEVKPDGEGLIQRLFYLKSKLPETPGRRFFDRYWKAFEEISRFKFDIEMDAESDSFKLYFAPTDSDTWRFADDCGLGLRELMVHLYFSLEATKTLVLIEEAENHLHPEMQRRLLWYLKEKTSDSKQFVLTTHSSVYLDTAFVDRVFQSRVSGGEVVVDDATSKATLLNNLGHSVADNLVSDLVIAVEGSGDKEVLTELLKRKGILGKYNIRFWILNGDAMASIDLEGFADRYSILVLLDSDPQSDDARKPFLTQCKRLNISVTKLKRYSIENYFPLALYRESFGEMIPAAKKELDPSKPVWGQLGSKVTRQAIKKGSRKFAAAVELEVIDSTDLGRFLREVQGRL